MLKQVYRILEVLKDFFKIIFNPVFQTWNWLTGWSGRPSGRPHHGPVDLTVDRRAQTYARLAVQGSGRPGGRPLQRVLLSGFLGRPGGRPVLPNGHIFDRWRSTGRSTGSSDRLQRLVFWQPINWGSCHCLKKKRF